MKPAKFALISAISLFFLLFLVLPIYTVVSEGLRLSYLLEIVRNPIYREGMLNGFGIALVTTVLVTLIAVPLALLNDAFDFRGKSLVTPLLLLPMILPPFVGALGFSQVFGRFGALNSLLTTLGLIGFGGGPDWLGGEGRFWAVCLIEAFHLYPIMYLNVLAALANLDPSLDEAARNLGCGRVKRFISITLPMIRPGLFAGASIVLIWSFTELGTPLMLGFNRVTTVQIFNGITELETNPMPYALVVILLAVACGLYTASRLAFGKNTETSPVKGMVGARSKKLSGVSAWLVFLPFLAVTAIATLPHFGILMLSFAGDWYGTILPSSYTLDHYRNALSHTLVVPGILNSLRFSLFATLLGVAVGLSISLMTVRWRTPGWQAFDLLSMMPLAVPGIVMAFGYLSMSIRYEWIRSIMDPVKNPSILLIIAYGMRRLPYVVRAVTAGLQQTPVELEHAARNLGAGSWLTLRKITVPLVAANIVIGALFAFSFSMLEVSDSLILAQRAEFFPVTRSIFELSQILGSGTYIACAFGVWAMVFLGTTLVVASLLMGKTIGSLFRF
jgi:iron(III) transport system permease protein